MEPDNKINIEEKVMSEIKSGRVKLRSKYIFLAEKLGLGSAFILTVLLAVLFFNLVLFYLKASDNLKYLSFGNLGTFAFLQSFPYLLVVAFIFLIFIAGAIMKKSGWSYQRPFRYFALGLVGFVMLAGIGLAFTKCAEWIERASYGPHPMRMFFRPFLKHGLEERQNGIAGRVIELGAGYIAIQTPRGIEKIDTSKLAENSVKNIQAGAFVIAVGEKTNKIFMAKQIQVVADEEMPMIRRGVHQRFGSFVPNRPPRDERRMNLFH